MFSRDIGFLINLPQGEGIVGSGASNPNNSFGRVGSFNVSRSVGLFILGVVIGFTVLVALVDADS